jgi:uroporphyrinogen III methyltransferase/synthase
VTVYLVGAGPGDPGLLTMRGAELLQQAEVVVHDRLVDPSLLSLAPPGAQIIDVGKRPAGAPSGDVAGGAERQQAINELLVEHGAAGRLVVRLKGGDPFLFGRGGEEAQALSAAGVDWEVVPGVTSAVAVPTAAGVPVTHRGLSTSVTVVTGRVGEPTAPGGVDWESLGRAGGTLVILMGVATRAAIAQQLLDAGRPPETPVAIVEWGTTPAQRVQRSTLARLGSVDAGSPSVIVVGEVAGLDLGKLADRSADTSTDRPLAGRLVVVTRSPEQSQPLATALRKAGADVVTVPVFEVAGPADGGAALRAAAATVSTHDWVAFTSANAVSCFVPLLRDARDLGSCRVAAVGRATAAALASHGVVADLLPGQHGQESTAAGLAEAIGAAPAGGGSVLFPRAADARRELVDGLQHQGWTVSEVEAYRTVPAPPPSPGVRAEVARADAIVFASPRTVTGWLAMTDPKGASMPVPSAVVCIGPVTADAAKSAGLDVAVTAEDPSVEGLVTALGGWFVNH